MIRTPSVPSRVAAWAAALVLTGSLTAQITVPGDFPDPQSAVDAASPGDVIVIQGGTWTPAQFGSQDPALRIDKAITLVGDPPPTFEPIVSGFGQQPPTILLEGPGSGEVVLVNIDVGGLTSGITWGAQTGGIVGGGFDALRIHDSTIAGPEWEFLTGVGAGSQAISVDVDYLLISDSTVRAADAADDSCYGSPALNGDAAVSCSGTVVVLDSIVTGGTYLNPCFPSNDCGIIEGGNGGPGIIAPRVDEAGSMVSGGPGAEWSADVGFCGTSADGVDVIADTHVVLDDDLALLGTTGLGDTVTLAWDIAAPVVHFYGSPGSVAPFNTIPGSTDVHLDPAWLRPIGSLLGGNSSADFVLPTDAAFLGMTYTIQGYAPPALISRPVMLAIGN